VATTTAPAWTVEPPRVDGAPVRRVAAVPGSDVLYAATATGLYRLETGSSARLGAEAPPNLLALDAQRLVGGAAPACARGDGEAPLRVSTDGGRTWRDATAPSGLRGATPRAIARDDVLALSCGGILWSRDGGATYSAPRELALANFEPRDVALSPDGRTAYAALVSEGGTLRIVRADRTDSGWAAAREIDTGWGTATLAVGRDGRVYLATAVDVKVSSDRGASWRSIATGLEPVLLAADPSKGALSDADTRKLREGVGATDLAVIADTIYAATAHGLYAHVGDAPWRRVPGVSSARSLAPAREALYVEADGTVVRLTRG
jgi:photosystem II stability/assembly factor-like uncharacterized protein